MKTILAGALAALLLGAPAASAEQKADSRLADLVIEAQRAELALRDAAIKAMAEDQAKRESALDDWFKGWFGDPKAAK